MPLTTVVGRLLNRILGRNMVLATPPMTGVTGKRWRLRGRFPEGELEGAPYQALVRHLLWYRGVQTIDDAARFMASADPGHDASLLPDIGPALDRLERAISQNELIAVYGDFDVDGTTSSAILIEALRELGARVVSYLPDRFAEGYGVHNTAIEKLASDGAALIITADCGTSNVAEVAHARTLDIDVLIIDHHTVPPELPAAVAIVNPKRTDSRYPEDELATGGLAFRVMGALYERLGRAFDPARYLDLVALSTVCDMAPLSGENRWLVQEGLRVLAKTQRPGLRALLEAAGNDPARVDASTIGYTIGPRLNAAGRLAHARLALELLMETDEGHARERAIELGALNQQRQQATLDALDLAKKLLAAEAPGQPLIFIGHADIPSGIVGLVAGRLMEECHRPVVVYEAGETTSRASCRSIPEFDITGALRNCKELLVRFGGHRAAAGFTVENANLPALKSSLLAQATQCLADVDLTPVTNIDAAVPLSRMNGEIIRSLAQMAPFGIGNSEPVFLSRGVVITDVRTMGGDGQHLRLTLRDGKVSWPAVAFGFGAEDVVTGQRLDVVYTFSADQGSEGALELRLTDFAPAAV